MSGAGKSANYILKRMLTSDPQLLLIGSVPDNKFLKRSGTEVVGADAGGGGAQYKMEPVTRAAAAGDGSVSIICAFVPSDVIVFGLGQDGFSIFSGNLAIPFGNRVNVLPSGVPSPSSGTNSMEIVDGAFNGYDISFSVSGNDLVLGFTKYGSGLAVNLRVLILGV